MRDCLQLGFDGKFYEDFYSVVVQVRVTQKLNLVESLRTNFTIFLGNQQKTFQLY